MPKRGTLQFDSLWRQTMIPSPHRRGRCAGPSAPKTLQSQTGPQPQKRPSVSRQPKAISFPTDAKLVHAAIKGLNRLAKKHGVGLRQSYLRIAKRAAFANCASCAAGSVASSATSGARSQSWGPRGGVAMAPRTRRSDPLPAAAPARLQALFLPRSRGRVHRQGQGLSVLRVRPSRPQSSPPMPAPQAASSCCTPRRRRATPTMAIRSEQSSKAIQPSPKMAS